VSTGGGYCQYRPAYALRATAGTRDSGPSAADQAPAQHHNPDGSHNRNVTITAYVVPIPPEELTDFPPLTVYFEGTDPDDRSPYDGKLEPSDPTNHWPNDNRDPQRRMWWDEAGNPAGYLTLQSTLCLTTVRVPQRMCPLTGLIDTRRKPPLYRRSACVEAWAPHENRHENRSFIA